MYGQAHGLGMASNALNDAFTQLLIIYFVRKMRGEQTKNESDAKKAIINCTSIHRNSESTNWWTYFFVIYFINTSTKKNIGLDNPTKNSELISSE